MENRGMSKNGIFPHFFYAGDIKKEKKFFLFAGDCANDFFNVFNG